MNQSAEKPVILITGAAGNLGQSLTQALSQNFRIIGLDRKPAEGVARAYTIDLTSEKSVKKTFQTMLTEEGSVIAAVIHLAAYFDFTGEESPLYEQVNVQGTRLVLEALQDFTVHRFIYASTMLVHQPGSPGQKIDETSPLDPRWAYPKSKAETEAVIREHAHRMPYTLLRLAGIYDDHTAVPTLSHQIARIYERRIKGKLYSGDTNAGQAFLHKDDMVQAFIRTIERRDELPKEHTLLVGEPICLSYETLQNRIGELLHGASSWHTFTVPEPIAKVGAWLEEKTEPIVPDDFDKGEKPFIRAFMIDMASDHYEIDIRRAQQELDWQPQHALYDVLPVMIENMKKDPLGWYAANKITPPDWLEEASERGRNPNDLLNNYQTQYRRQHQNNIWASFMNLALGGWLITSAPVMNYAGTSMVYSDLIAGSLLMILAVVSLSWRMGWARWACAVIGVWLLFAPLALWTPSAAAYLNNTLVGILAIGFAVLTKPTPCLSPVAVLTGPDIPPGWNRNPSSWFQRAPIIFLAFIGFFISRYMTAYQLGHIDGVWDPFFSGVDSDKNGTEFIITSPLSEAWPVPDAGLGAMTYAMEILVGLIGSQQRWRTMPWLVTLFGIMIVPLGIVSITFIIIQPILLGTWCTPCLIAAAAMLIQIPYSLDELLATGQFLKRRHDAGKPVLKIFFTGDTDEGEARKRDDNFEQPPLAVLRAFFSGAINLPWNLALCILVGIWLMLTRITLGHEGSMANWDHLVGSLVITVSVCALAEMARPARFLIIPLGGALLVTPFIFNVSGLSMAVTLATGVALIVLSIPRGAINSQFGNWNRYLV